MIDYGEMIERGMSADELRLVRERVGGRSYQKKGRYGNVARRTEYNGVMYDSKLEADYAAKLDLEMQAGKVAWWIRQVTISLGPDCKTRVDFLVGEWMPCRGGHTTIHAAEVKGVESREFKRVRKLWPKYGPFQLAIITKHDVEIIEGRQP